MRDVQVLVLLICGACAQASSTGPASLAVIHQLQPGSLEAVTRTYTVSYEGSPIGEYVYALTTETEAGRSIVRVRRAFTLPQGPVEQLAVFDARTFEPIRAESRGAIAVALEKTGPRVRGTVGTSDTAVQHMDEPLPAGALLPYMFEAVVAASPLQPGYAREFQVVNPASARIEAVGLRVVGEDTVTVPAGTFAVYRVEITGFEPETAYLLKETPHIAVRQDLASPVSIQLASVTPLRD